jgi:hypothetical protein
MTRYRQQAMMEQMSRAGLIPTYSFPTNEISLEVIRQLGQQADRAWAIDTSEVKLNRDGTLAISEYSPGAEVVAAHRVWVSRGIADYPGDFQRKHIYRICKDLQSRRIAADRG